MLIKELVKHVQLKVDKHGNSYHKNPKKKINATQNKNSNAVMEIDEIQLKNELQQKVIGYFQQYVPDLDTDLIEVKLLVKNGQNIYGEVHCIICKIENRKKQIPKRVFFNANGKNKGVWVLSNFKKHLQNSHITVAQSKFTNLIKTPQKRKVSQKEETRKSKTSRSKSIDINELSCSIEIVEVVDSNKLGDEASNEDKENASLILVNDEDFEREENKKYDDPDDLFTQLSSQVTKVHGAVLTNSESQQSINFVLNKSPRKVTITNIDGDGNCMFGSLAHQLWFHKINSDEHIGKTEKLRAEVVNHILDPKNFSRFEHLLHDRIYSIREKANKLKEITNISADCKLFVRHALSKEGMWGGRETLLAVSDLYSTNVVVFNEEGNCDKVKQAGRNYNRSVAIAYGFGCNEKGDRVRNHYDSVCDINSNDIFAVARHITNK